jgi:hypothetical protein
MRWLAVPLTLLFSAPALATDVLLVYAVPSQGYAIDVVSKLTATGRFGAVDPWNGAVSTPTVQDLANYDAVMLMPDTTYFDATGLGNNLATYVDNGGGVVDTLFSVNFSALYVSGRWFSDGYRPFDGNTQGNLNGTLVPDLAGHPLLNRVNSYGFRNSGYYGPNVVLSPGGELVASWSNGVPLLATAQKPNSGVVVGINSYMVSTDAAPFGWDTASDGTALMANALLYAANGGGGAFSASAGGTCPGTVVVNVNHAGPRANIALATGNPRGNFTLPGGACAGLQLPISAPTLRGTFRADAGGTLTRSFVGGGAVCGATVVAVDLDTCTASNAATLP